jgi:hypothetical protein
VVSALPKSQPASWRVGTSDSRVPGPRVKFCFDEAAAWTFDPASMRLSEMEARPTDGYIRMGLAVRLLVDAVAGLPVFRIGFAFDSLDQLLRSLPEYELHVTARIAHPLIRIRDRWNTERSEHHDDDAWIQARRLSDTEAEELRGTAITIQETILAEARGNVAFITRDKRYDVGRLLNDVGALMPPGVFENLSAKAQYDFGQAGKCVAYEVPTAAAFHLMRGTEAVLRDFYCTIVRRDRVDPLLWGPMTMHLAKRSKPPPDVLLNNLDNLRRSFRNPTQHPEKIYDIEEVQDLFALSIDVVSRMTR